MTQSLLRIAMVFLVAALGQSFSPSATAETPQLTTETIQKVLAAAVAKAREIKVPMGISVVDQGGNLVGFIKMEGTFVHTNHTSYSKAYTAASVRRPTHETGIPPQIATELASTTGGKFTALPGGFPLIADGQVIGAIGVGGGNAEQDMAVARAGAGAIK